MASASSWTLEIASPVAAPRLFRAAVMDWHTLAPKLVADVVASAHPVEGEGAVGSVRQFNFTPGMCQPRAHIQPYHHVSKQPVVTCSLSLQPCRSTS
jgi:hypothetical protein